MKTSLYSEGDVQILSRRVYLVKVICIKHTTYIRQDRSRLFHTGDHDLITANKWKPGLYIHKISHLCFPTQKQTDNNCIIIHVDQAEVASVLLQNDADINAQTTGGQTPLHLAATYTRDNLLLQVLLMDKRLNPNIVNCQNQTALDLAKRSGKESLFELIEGSVNVQW